MLLIDFSVIVKFFSREDGWEKVKGYIAESLTIQLAIVELSSALSKKVLRGDVDENIALEILEEYSKKAILLDQARYIDSAFKLSITKNITIYDSFFIAARNAGGVQIWSHAIKNRSR